DSILRPDRLPELFRRGPEPQPGAKGRIPKVAQPALEQALLGRFVHGTLRGQYQDNDVYRLAIQTRIVESAAGNRQRGYHPVETSVPDVWDRNAFTNPCRSQLVATDHRSPQLRHQCGREEPVG